MASDGNILTGVFPTIQAPPREASPHTRNRAPDRRGEQKNQGCTPRCSPNACDSSAAGQGSPAFSEQPALRSRRDSDVHATSLAACSEHNGGDVGCRNDSTRSRATRYPSATGRSAPIYRAFSATGMSAPAPSFRGRYSSRRHAPRATAATTAASTIMLFTFMVFSPSSAIAPTGYRGGPLRSRTQLLFQRFSTPVDAKMPLELCTSAKPNRATRHTRDGPPMQWCRARP